MNNKILSLLIAGVLSTTAIVALAEGVEKTEDVTLISAEETIATNEFTGIVKSVDENNIVIEVETENGAVEVAFVITDKTVKEEVKAGDLVTVSSTSELLTKDIKEALSITAAVVEETEIATTVNKYTGTVKAVSDENVIVVFDDVESGMEVNFMITENTAIYKNNGEKAEAVKMGDNVTVCTESLLLTMDIKEAKALIINDEESVNAVYVDTFNKTEMGLLSSDGELVLNIEDEKIAEYDGKELLVFYEIATMSIPAQTNPTAVVVLSDGEVAGTQSVEISFKVGDSILKINGEDVEVETPYVVGEGTTLVPLRVISEAFGAEVNWDGETKTVVIIHNENAITIQIDNNKAFVNDGEETLEEAPQLTENGFTMVPLRFISETLGAEVSYDEATQGITVSL